MKFLFELVPCFVPQPSDTSAAAEQPGNEETRSTRPPRRRKRGRVVGLPGNAAAEWKPSLSSISEGKAVIEKSPENGTPAGERQVRQKGGSGGGSKSKIHVRSRSEGFGTDSYETVIPAFAPTPFIL